MPLEKRAVSVCVCHYSNGIKTICSGTGYSNSDHLEDEISLVHPTRTMVRIADRVITFLMFSLQCCNWEDNFNLIQALYTPNRYNTNTKKLRGFTIEFM